MNQRFQCYSCSRQFPPATEIHKNRSPTSGIKRFFKQKKQKTPIDLKCHRR